MYVEGRILAGPAFEPIEGRLHVADGEITAIEETSVESDDIVSPAFVNAHTHLGDSVAKDAAVGLGLEAAVAPPDSRKHERLRAADREESIDAMARTIRYMARGGTAAFCDFREFGVDGATALRAAADRIDSELGDVNRAEIEDTDDAKLGDSDDAKREDGPDGTRVTGGGPRAFVFGSDDPAVLDVADGFGASGANDDTFDTERAATREAGKPFAIHAGEPDDTDIHPALDLEPDLLVHMIHAREEHLERVADRGVPIAVCPRANAALGVGRVPLRDQLEHTTVALGTDNVMVASPNMFREMAFTARLFDVDDQEVLRMATRAGAEIMGSDAGLLEVGRPAAFQVLDGDSDNLAGCAYPRRAVVRRAGPSDVKRVVLSADV